MNMDKIFLGTTVNDELAFAEYHKYEDGRAGFGFFTVRPFRASDVDEDYVWDWLDGFGKEILYDFCVDYDCSPNELATEVLDNSSIGEIIDISLFPNCITVDGEDWYFESSACGQHDLRDEMSEYANKEAFDTLISMWDEYHLKSIPNDKEQIVLNAIEALCDIDYESFIENYIREELA